MRFSIVGLELCDLLGVKFLPGSAAQAGIVGRTLERVLRAYNEGEQLEAAVHLDRLALFAKQLTEVRNFDHPTFERFRTRLLSGSAADFHGVRQEALVAARLARSHIPFLHEQKNQPDFLVPGYENAGIECTSVHFTKETIDDPTYKIGSAVKGKGIKGYASAGVAVAIGITELDSRGGMNVDVRGVTEGAVAAGPFGGVILFTELLLLDRAPPEFRSVYRRVDGPNMFPSLLDLLNTLWPRGDLEVRQWAIPQAPY